MQPADSAAANSVIGQLWVSAEFLHVQPIPQVQRFGDSSKAEICPAQQVYHWILN